MIGVVTDRDTVCRVLAAGRNPLEHTVQDCTSQPAITVHLDTTLTDFIASNETATARLPRRTHSRSA
jgi:CBS domain-containing protein